MSIISYGRFRSRGVKPHPGSSQYFFYFFVHTILCRSYDDQEKSVVQNSIKFNVRKHQHREKPRILSNTNYFRGLNSIYLLHHHHKVYIVIFNGNKCSFILFIYYLSSTYFPSSCPTSSNPHSLTPLHNFLTVFSLFYLLTHNFSLLTCFLIFMNLNTFRSKIFNSSFPCVSVAIISLEDGAIKYPVKVKTSILYGGV
jgi:hypothetical protein